MGRALQHDHRHAHGDGQLVDRPHLAARDLPRHQAEPARPEQCQLPALDDHGLHGRHRRPGGEPRTHRRHVRPGPPVQPGISRLHGGIDPALAGVHHRPQRRAGADPLPPDPGCGRSDDLRLLDGHPHRRVPTARARHGAGHQRRGRGVRLVHRAHRRRAAEHDGLAPGLPRVGAGRLVRHRVGLSEVA